jgi:DNA-binding XRE family transcriptional regulator
MPKPKRLKWHDKQYQIYAYIDPRDSTVRYVGMTADAHSRHYEHLHNLGGGWKERKWVSELRAVGLQPLFQILETIGACDNAHEVACQREQYWIEKYVRIGAPLINVVGVVKPYSKRERAARPQQNSVQPSGVRELRIKAALNVTRLAQLADVSRPTIEKMEKDEPVRADLASAVCHVLSEKLGYEVTIESAEIKVL